MIAQPKKRIKEIIRTYGGKHHASDRTGDSYIFPDMFVLHVTRNPTGNWVASQDRNLTKRYGRPAGDQFSHLTKATNYPRIDFERLVATGHAKERLHLMQTQGAVEFREVLYCLRMPERVLWSDRHESWVWVNGRIAVAVTETDHIFYIKTILWAALELFEAHPRPERELS